MKPILSTSISALALLALISFTQAGCDVNLGFRVQYSDMAMLGYVQLQVLDSENEVLVENIDNSTREDWDAVRAKNITWSVPQDWSAGDYIFRAFGEAYYSCKKDRKPSFCALQLEDRETIHVQHLMEEQDCPAIISPSLTHSTTASSSSLETPLPTTESKNSTDSASSTSQEELSPSKDGSPTITLNIGNAILNWMKQNGISVDQLANSTINGKLLKEIEQQGNSLTSSEKQVLSQSGASKTKISYGASLGLFVVLAFF
ncbi:hypothetical protein BGZ49_002145 [Haplosporangium sp. Z 27]|nr:hypothetical protein BGZ49_002145 [Haplosporangium sp. Z 27]